LKDEFERRGKNIHLKEEKLEDNFLYEKRRKKERGSTFYEK
jgi:hypothetical protein